MSNYIILAQYTKSKKNTWWEASDNYTWKIGRKYFIPGTTTEVEIINVINLNESKEMRKAICDVYDNTDISEIKERLEKFTY